MLTPRPKSEVCVTRELKVRMGRGSKGLENKIINPDETLGTRDGPILCDERLGGLLKYYRRAAA